MHVVVAVTGATREIEKYASVLNHFPLLVFNLLHDNQSGFLDQSRTCPARSITRNAQIPRTAEFTFRDKVFRVIDFCIGPKSVTRNWISRTFLKLKKFVLMPQFQFFFVSL